jgi:hypothetical protein
MATWVKIVCHWTQSTKKDPQICKDIKLCASSREENDFMDGFKPLQRLRLQELNRIDFTTFVQERLTSHDGFPRLKFTKEATQSQFIDQIVDRADGVFLWASLVMITLREGLSNGNELSTLQRKLDSTPSDITKLFVDIIDRIHETDPQEAARTFSVISTLWKCSQLDKMTLFAHSF